MLNRNITANILEALEDTPVVFLNGARQTGKSTLMQTIGCDTYPAEYITLDDSTILAAASADPQAFVEGFESPVIIDEVQRVPELFLAIKAAVDKNRVPGKFLLTGSANVLLLPKISESLVGRMEILNLWPLSQGEIEAKKESFIDKLFIGKSFSSKKNELSRSELITRILTGGFPEILQRKNPERQKAWFSSYITTILQRDVRDISNIEGLTTLPRLLSVLATRLSSLLNFSELSRTISMPQSTLKRYLALLETIFLFKPLPAWSGNLGKRVVKSPKIILTDTGLASNLLGTDLDRIKDSPQLLGQLFENFVVMEFIKQSSWSKTKPEIFHFRAQAGYEVDIILEDAAGRVIGVEVKSGLTVRNEDFKGLRFLQQEIGDKFLGGIILYAGSSNISFGPQLRAMPVSNLWLE